jgi:hypothetical protein
MLKRYIFYKLTWTIRATDQGRPFLLKTNVTCLTSCYVWRLHFTLCTRVERVRYCIDQTTLKLQLQLIYGTTSVPRTLKDILNFLCSVLFCSLFHPIFYISRIGSFSEQSWIKCVEPDVCLLWTSVVLMTIQGYMRIFVGVLNLLFTYLYLKDLI